ncbi:MAG: BtpA/SgcQ family protein [Gemmatimonadetes bacterium]|nr:BtpA/SgcQ family protein [Gemmatimonadota bacterium]
MTVRGQGVDTLWPDHVPVIGMVHLLALPGAPRWGGSMGSVIERAFADAEALVQAGFRGLIVENYSDVPFFGGPVPAETIAAMTTVTSRIVEDVDVPVGVNVLRNDAHAAFSIAAAVGARFVRVNVHTGSMFTDQGLVEGRAAETLRLRESLQADVAILADVHVKHAVPPPGSSIGASASDAWHRGLADGLIVSGVGTGSETDLSEVEAVRRAVPEAPLFVGSGVSSETAATYLRSADGLVVGSALMHDGRAGAGVDPERAKTFMEAAGV